MGKSRKPDAVPGPARGRTARPAARRRKGAASGPDPAPPAAEAAPLAPRRRAFLAAYEETASISQAARAARIHRSTHYQWLRDEDYRRRFLEIQAALGDLLFDEAVRRALAGSDQLLQFLLRGLKPEVFNRQQVEVLPPGGFAGMAVWQLSDEQLEEEIRRCRRVAER